MRKKTEILGVFIFLLLIIYIMFRPHSKSVDKFKIVEFKQENVILNQTNKPYLDTILHIGLKHLNIKGVTILVKDLNSEIKNSLTEGNGLITEAFILGDKNQYIIYIDNFNRLKSIIVLSHELIHLKQYHDERIIDYDDEMVWDNIIYTNEEIKDMYYFNRPWEKEAFDNQEELNKKIKNDLY